jgi:biopolymer transport protein ExbB
MDARHAAVTELADDLLLLFERGGVVLWVILAMSVLMWALILDRYLHYFFVVPRRRVRLLRQWRQDRGDGRPPKYRAGAMMAAFSAPLHRFLLPIHTLSSILPLLGLLGTISGMIKVFEVITVFGVGNARGMAAGISEALITTMAGLVTALSGLYFCVNLQSLAERASDHFAMRLNQKGDSR